MADMSRDLNLALGTRKVRFWTTPKWDLTSYIRRFPDGQLWGRLQTDGFWLGRLESRHPDRALLKYPISSDSMTAKVSQGFLEPCAATETSPP